MSGGLLVAGTTSDAGKSVVTAGLCRWLRRRGVRVAPFKAQNMSNNSVVAVGADGRGGEIGRAQAMQAAACGLAPDVRFNPVLLKPGGDMTSQVVLLGHAVGTAAGRDYRAWKPRLAGPVFDTYAALRREYDVVVCEGAGSPAEINLRADDFVNLGLARRMNLPAVVVGDIDRGGVFASFFGTLALLAAADQAHVAGFVVNKFRGHRDLLRPGLDALAGLTGRPVLGVLPYAPDLWLDGEDSLAHGAVLGRPAPPRGTQWLRVAVVRLPRISNATDAEALAAEPGVRVRLTTDPAEVADADLVVLPGTKATVADLDWLRRTGLADAVVAHARAGRPLLGLCGGFQMLGRRIHDDVESGRGTVDGLGLLPLDTTFAADKTVRRAAGTAFGGVPVAGYEIHHGRVTAAAEGLAPLLLDAARGPEGARVGNVLGTHWHGAFESDDFRRAFLTDAARAAGRAGFAVAPDTRFGAAREATLDLLGDLVEEHLDTAALWRLIDGGPPRDLPFVPPGAPDIPATATPDAAGPGRFGRPGTAAAGGDAEVSDAVPDADRAAR
ncbi:cobyric acid synthase [Pilimelia anulata]|uniref:Cobyric acid synthase n=1 Tax=Pilimelia anulata TaxID=53371 RepID=A0A8J3F9F4_9ACTN|nr:cobyric acid synthase [Pilimelia anulata]GGJ93526.1 cobyric acid synthase [Pilimelia anulata]